MEPLYLPNDQPLLPPAANVQSRLQATLSQIVTEHPPQPKWNPEECLGGWAGPTSLAYLFLHVSAAHADMIINGQPAMHWAQQYLDGERGPDGPQPADPRMCGLLGEKTSFEAIYAAVTKDISYVEGFLASIPTLLAGDFVAEIVYGRSGILYMLRMIRHWAPESAPLLEESIAQVTESILAEGPDWKAFDNKRFLGVGHGDIGIITQLVLTTPSLAPRVQPWVARLLDWQRENGNWDKEENNKLGKPLVQFCHGAPGFVISLVTLRPYFPDLHNRIDTAIEKGRALTWKEGVLKKRPNLCHGTLGNAMAFPPGEKRNHFLGLSTPDRIEEGKKKDTNLYEFADYGIFGLNMSYLPGLAWVLLKLEDDGASISLYTDI